mgnify:CR=1 FL=1
MLTAPVQIAYAVDDVFGADAVAEAIHGAVLGTGGRGLAIVERLSHRWGITPSADGGKSVWAWFDKDSFS